MITGEIMHHLSKKAIEVQKAKEIDEICSIIKNGYKLGLSNHNELTPSERYEFALKLEQVCNIAEWMAYYVKPN